jgi:hypothetical protein
MDRGEHGTGPKSGTKNKSEFWRRKGTIILGLKLLISVFAVQRLIEASFFTHCIHLHGCE